MNGFFRPHPDSADGEDLLSGGFGFAGVALGESCEDGGSISLVGEGACVDDGYVQPDPDAIDVVPGFDVVQSHDEEAKLFEEGDGDVLDVHVVGFDVEGRAQLQNGFSCHQRLGHPFVAALEQKLPVQIGNLPYPTST